METKNPLFIATVDKYYEAGYFLHQMAHNYHDSGPFRYNLNGFIQAFRNITFIMQSEGRKIPKFDPWYALKQEEMKKDPLMRNFVNARNLIVKQDMLAVGSKAEIGLFRGRRLKLAMNHEVSPFMDTEELMEAGRKFIIGFILDEEHSAIGEQFGVRREWVVKEIMDGEIIGHCVTVFAFARGLVSELCVTFDRKVELQILKPPMDEVQVLLEQDLDPSLPKKWGWV